MISLKISPWKYPNSSLIECSICLYITFWKTKFRVPNTVLYLFVYYILKNKIWSDKTTLLGKNHQVKFIKTPLITAHYRYIQIYWRILIDLLLSTVQRKLPQSMKRYLYFISQHNDTIQYSKHQSARKLMWQTTCLLAMTLSCHLF